MSQEDQQDLHPGRFHHQTKMASGPEAIISMRKQVWMTDKDEPHPTEVFKDLMMEICFNSVCCIDLLTLLKLCQFVFFSSPKRKGEIILQCGENKRGLELNGSRESVTVSFCQLLPRLHTPNSQITSSESTQVWSMTRPVTHKAL